MRVDRAVAAVQRIAPDAIHQLRARQHRARPRQQRRQHAVLVAGQVERLAAIAHALAFGIQFERSVPQPRFAGRDVMPPQARAHARHQFARREWFHDVIVGTEFEAEHAVDLAIARGQEDHRHVADRAQRAADVEPA